MRTRLKDDLIAVRGVTCKGLFCGGYTIVIYAVLKPLWWSMRDLGSSPYGNTSAQNHSIQKKIFDFMNLLFYFFFFFWWSNIISYAGSYLFDDVQLLTQFIINCNELHRINIIPCPLLRIIKWVFITTSLTNLSLWQSNLLLWAEEIQFLESDVSK